MRVDQFLKTLTPDNHKQIEMGLAQLEQDWFFEFDDVNSFGQNPSQSPEDRHGELTERVISNMVKCRNLDYFYDVVFVLDSNEKIRVNSAVLCARSDYFRAMFNSQYGFKESYFTHYFEDAKDPSNIKTLKRVVRLCGVPKQFFAAIVQYLYSDTFIVVDGSLTFYLNLMIYADFFMLQRLNEICQSHLAQFVKPKNCLELYLVAKAHNAEQLENYCLHFIAANEEEISKSPMWKELQQKCAIADENSDRSILNDLTAKILFELEEDFGEISVQRAIQQNGKTDWPKYEFESNVSSARSSFERLSNSKSHKNSMTNFLVQSAFMTTCEIVSHGGFGKDLTQKQV